MGRRAQSAEELFWAKVDRSGGPDACWLWQAAVKHGYGHCNFRGKTMRSHRVAYQLTHGPIPRGEGHHGMTVCHTCDTPLCVNPGHLFLATQRDNIADMVAKRRQKGAVGVRNGRARLTPGDVIEIRRLRQAGMVYREIAARFGVDRTTVAYAGRGDHWRHIA